MYYSCILLQFHRDIMFKIGYIFRDACEICKKTLYQILIMVYSTETSTNSGKYMTLGKLFIMKQSIIISKIYKQDLVVWNRVSFSTNALPI